MTHGPPGQTGEVSRFGLFRRRFFDALIDSPAVERDQLLLLARQARQDGASCVFFSLLVAIILGSPRLSFLDDHVPIIWAWFGAFCFWGPAMWFTGSRLLALPPEKVKNSRWRAIFAGIYIVNGLLWASTLLLLPSDVTQDARLFLYLVLAGHLMTYLVNLASHLLVLSSALLATVVATEAIMLTADDDLSVMLSIVFLPFSGMILVLGRDASSRLGANLRRTHELRALSEELESARRAVEVEAEAKSRFFASMSHELRTPLNAIVGFSEVMSSEMLGAHRVPAYREYARNIQSSGVELTALVDDLLAYSANGGFRFELQSGPTELWPLLTEVNSALLAAGWKGECGVRNRLETEALVVIDRPLIKQTLIHLGSQAIAIAAGQGPVELSGRWIGEDRVLIAVRFPGRLSDEVLNSLDDPFRQRQQTDLSGERGISFGLGLVRARSVVQQHGGSFDVVDLDGGQTEFRITLAALPDQAANEERVA